ncbi:hypothetical protein CEXT_287091 [Caerostris extrusa]|uniref:Uncharacterized protein n=1 Tax=Caerostris extrusa TaxID=172846 RepID=A0AAV4VD66_CAEEX|nr:hypothetical protein CEXT_287091 [Caerostris extrusa]
MLVLYQDPMYLLMQQKQLADKERVTAALENDYLRETINISLMDEMSQTLPKFVEEALRKTNKLDHPKVFYIQNSRQHIESYRRWYDIIYSDEKTWKSSLSFNRH